MLYSISLALAFLFAAMAVFLPFSTLYVKFKYVHNMHVFINTAIPCLLYSEARNNHKNDRNRLVRRVLVFDDLIKEHSGQHYLRRIWHSRNW